MEIDQLIFKKVWKFIASLQKEKNTDNPETTVYLNDIKNKLTIIARSLSGNAIEIFPAENYSCSKNNIYFLPEKYTRFPDYAANYFYYIFRVFYLQAEQLLKTKINLQKETGLANSLYEAYLLSTAVIEKLQQEYPLLITHYEALFSSLEKTDENLDTWHKEWFGKLLANDIDLQNNAADKKVNQWEQLNEINKDVVELNAKTKENIDVLEVNKIQQEEYTLTHNFEKIETLDDFNGNWRDFEDDEDLDENSDALDELNMNQMVRVDSPSHSVLHADFFNSLGIKEATENNTGIITKKLDEWDYTKRKYKKNFCNIYESTFKETAPEYTRYTFNKNKNILHNLEKKLNHFFNAYQKVSRQCDGEEPDLDAITERFTDIFSGFTPSENIFLSKRKKNKDAAILILADISLSTDGYVEGHRILDTEKQSLLLFCEVLNRYGTPFQIDVFSSKTRNHCEYQTVKKMAEDWNISKHRIGALSPKGYTRIGAAIRNAHEQMKNNTARKRWILLLTDGKPNDYDRYEGKYGIEDVKQAVREVRKDDIQISALAIDSNAKFYLPQMLGKGAFQLVHHPQYLPEALSQFYLELMK